MVKPSVYGSSCALLFAAVLCLLPGCASRQAEKEAVVLPFSSHDPITSKLVKQFQQWYATPYRLGGMDRDGVDCSGFVNVTYRQLFDVRLPRTTEKLALSGSKVPVSDLRSGDLVLFKTGWKGNHVGIFLENGTFMHVSETSGVMLSSLHEAYWKNHFWQARRIFN